MRGLAPRCLALCMLLVFCGACGCAAVRKSPEQATGRRTIVLASGTRLQVWSDGASRFSLGGETRLGPPRVLYFFCYQTPTDLQDCNGLSGEVAELEEDLLERATRAEADEILVKVMADPAGPESRWFRWFREGAGWVEVAECTPHRSVAPGVERGAAEPEDAAADARKEGAR